MNNVMDFPQTYTFTLILRCPDDREWMTQITYPNDFKRAFDPLPFDFESAREAKKQLKVRYDCANHIAQQIANHVLEFFNKLDPKG